MSHLQQGEQSQSLKQPVDRTCISGKREVMAKQTKVCPVRLFIATNHLISSDSSSHQSTFNHVRSFKQIQMSGAIGEQKIDDVDLTYHGQSGFFGF